jgi:WXG100 family type VII secretion target
MSDEIRADYQQLEQISQRFANQAQAVQQTAMNVSRSMQKLQGNWVGRGSNAFFREMEGVVIPGVKRLFAALQEASTKTRQIAQTVKQAEEEASGLFKAGK